MMADFSSDQFQPFLDLDMFDQDFCPQFDIHDNPNISVNHFSTDSSSNNSDSIDVDFQDELEKILGVEGSESILGMDDHFDMDFLSSNQDDINNNHGGDFSVKVEEDSFDDFLDNSCSSVLSSKVTKEKNVKTDCLTQKVKVDGERTTKNLAKPAVYVGHIQRKPERTILPPKLNSMKMMLSHSNEYPHPAISKQSLEKRVTFSGRQMVSLLNKKTGQSSSNLHLQPSRFQVSGKKLNPPELKAHSLNPTLGSAITKLNSDSLLLAKLRNQKPAQSKMILVRKPGGAGPSKSRGGISILKPFSPNSQQPSLTTKPVKASLKHSKDARLQMKERKAMKNQTKKQRILGKLITLPKVQSPGPVISPSGWVTKEDPTKEVKNQQERDRRGQLAMYREKLKKLLPQAQGVEKVATVTVLEMAREYCGMLKNQCDQLETDQLEEEEKNCMLKRMLGILTKDQPCLPQKEVSAEEVMTIETFFERFEVEM